VSKERERGFDRSREEEKEPKAIALEGGGGA